MRELVPRAPQSPSHSTWRMQFNWKVISFRVVITTLIGTGLLCLWYSRLQHPHRSPVLSQVALRKALLSKLLDHEHTFVPASDGLIHYVGRWTPTSNLLRQESSFSGSCIDLSIANATSLYISLHNELYSKQHDPSLAPGNDHLQMSLRPVIAVTKPAAPVDLLVQIDHVQYLQYPGTGHGLVAISKEELDITVEHHIRIMYVGDHDGVANTIEFEGVWLSQGGHLIPISDTYGTTGPEMLGSKRTVEEQRPVFPSGEVNGPRFYKKTVEIITDSPSSVLSSWSKARDDSGDTPQSMLLAMSSWSSRLAESFNIDCVAIPVQDFCLTDKCNNNSPAQSQITTHDLFFRSGAPRTPLFTRPWSFQSYVPDVLILDLGSNDFASQTPPPLSNHDDMHYQSSTSLIHAFTASYTTLVTTIRKSAYPLHPSALKSNLSDGYVYNSAPSTLPIFVILPFTASPLLAKTLQSIVAALRKDGDIATFFLDTTGWLTESGDFEPNSRILSAQGHRKAAALMQMHLCRYLVSDEEVDKCPFRRHDVYEGSVSMPQETELERVVLENKIGKIKAMFGIQGDEL